MPESQSLHFFRRDLISQFLTSSSSLSGVDGAAMGAAGVGHLSLQELPPRIAGEFGAAVASDHTRLSQGRLAREYFFTRTFLKP